jgi:hypothetical protein
MNLWAVEASSASCAASWTVGAVFEPVPFSPEIQS